MSATNPPADLHGNLKTPYTKLDPAGLALLVIDAQNDFAHPRGAFPLPGLDGVVPRLVRAIELFKAAGRPVIRVVRLYRPDGSNVDLCRRWQVEQGQLAWAAPHDWGSQLVEASNPAGTKLAVEDLLAGRVQTLAPGDYVIYKPRFSAFVNTDLHQFLGRMGVNSLVIVGLTFANCVRATQISATDLDYRVGLVPDACTDTDAKGLAVMQAMGVQLMTMADLEDLLAPAG